jgi:hypothetical protein
MYQKREDREERGYFKVMPEVLLGAFAVVCRVGGFGGESPGGFVSFAGQNTLQEYVAGNVGISLPLPTLMPPKKTGMYLAM